MLQIMCSKCAYVPSFVEPLIITDKLDLYSNITLPPIQLTWHTLNVVTLEYTTDQVDPNRSCLFAAGLPTEIVGSLSFQTFSTRRTPLLVDWWGELTTTDKGLVSSHVCQSRFSESKKSMSFSATRSQIDENLIITDMTLSMHTDRGGKLVLFDLVFSHKFALQ